MFAIALESVVIDWAKTLRGISTTQRSYEESRWSYEESRQETKFYRSNQCCIPVFYGHTKEAMGGISTDYSTMDLLVRQRTKCRKTIRTDINKIHWRIRGISDQRFIKTEISRRGHSSWKLVREIPSEEHKCRAYPLTIVPGIWNNLLKEVYASRRTGTMVKRTHATRCSSLYAGQRNPRPRNPNKYDKMKRCDLCEFGYEMTRARGISDSQMQRLSTNVRKQ